MFWNIDHFANQASDGREAYIWYAGRHVQFEKAGER